jgi:hypothetical protein
VDLIQSVEGLHRTKTLVLLRVRYVFLCDFFELEYWFFHVFTQETDLLILFEFTLPSFQLELVLLVLLILRLGLELYHELSLGSSLLTVDLGTFNLHNLMSQSPIINFILRMQISY